MYIYILIIKEVITNLEGGTEELEGKHGSDVWPIFMLRNFLNEQIWSEDFREKLPSFLNLTTKS